MMGHKSRYISTLTLAAAAAMAIAFAPAASATPGQLCVDSGTSTVCQTPGNTQITTDTTHIVSGDGLSSYGPFFVYDRPPFGDRAPQ
jgi:hypothetical protein